MTGSVPNRAGFFDRPMGASVEPVTYRHSWDMRQVQEYQATISDADGQPVLWRSTASVYWPNQKDRPNKPSDATAAAVHTAVAEVLLEDFAVTVGLSRSDIGVLGKPAVIERALAEADPEALAPRLRDVVAGCVAAAMQVGTNGEARSIYGSLQTA